MENNRDTISPAIEAFTKHIANLSDEEIEKRLSKYDNSKYSGLSIGELDTLLPISKQFTQTKITQKDVYLLCILLYKDFGEGIKINIKTDLNPQNFAGFFIKFAL
jgi:hypothetical protein